MTDLSPAAQAVVTAIEKFDWESGYFFREDIWVLSKEVTVAALRAAAEQIEDLYCESDVDDSDGVVFAMRQLMLIAAELEDNA